MAFRARKSIKISKGVRLNLSTKGVGVSAGVKGARYSAHSSGRRTKTLSLPGTGLSYVSTSGTKGGATRVKASSELTEAQQAKLVERFNKKVQLASERRQKPLDKLKEKYAQGKINKNQFEALSKRDKDITLDFVVFGKSPGIKLAERYLLGLIDNDEFEDLRNELLGAPEAERDLIVEGFNERVSAVRSQAEKARANLSDVKCNLCDKQKKFYAPLMKEEDYKLCSSCKFKSKKLRNYEGYNGSYYVVSKHTIQLDGENRVRMNIVPEHILAYR